MKKLAIAGASAVLAALPVVGVFADDYNPIIDTVQVTINDSCAMSAAASGGEGGQTGGVYAATVNAGTLVTPGGSGTGQADWGAGGSTTTAKTYTFSCNKNGGWKVTAQGVKGTTGTDATTAQTTMPGINAASTPIATGPATSGATSNWAFQVSATKVTPETAYTGTNWASIPATATTIIQSDAGAPVSEATFTPAYRVWVSATQQADTYTGYVKYVLTAPLS
ncbi:hypothetical protein IIY24_01790 [Candidatus Saccharibacteria bacterium]|nr:hypothetical protein [Candidatus Saccharibacteria bacterium]